eukprot:scaffold39012_cov191-Amphora_coffeaeformis.AAC.1
MNATRRLDSHCFPRRHSTTASSSLLTLYSLSGNIWILAASYHPQLSSASTTTTTTTTTRIMTTETNESSSDSNRSSSNKQNGSKMLVFDSIEELQTRLVLLPRVEEEGVGAIVEHYMPKQQGDGGEPASPDEENNIGNDTVQGIVVEAIIMENEDEPKSLKDLEFAEILALLRAAAPPVRLQLAYNEEEEEEEEEHDEEEEPENDNQTNINAIEQQTPPPVVEKESVKAPEKSSSVEPMFEEEKKMDPADDQIILDHGETEKAESTSAQPESTSSKSSKIMEDTAVSMQHSLMSWASRFNVSSSVQMATERAQQAMEVAEQKRKAATAAMASSMSSPLQSRTVVTTTETTHPRLDVDLFIQTSSGAFLSLPKEKQKLSSELRVTNSSLLTIRKSAMEACSPDVYSFQWYRSLERRQDSPAATPKNNNSNEPDEWVELPGATSRTFQPTATEVGHKIRCVVTKLDDSDDEYSDSGEDENTNFEKPWSASLVTFECVSAALALFNGARQALVKGAQFGGIQGLGNASGRTFHIKVSMLITKDPTTRKSTSTSALCFYQVSGSTSEPIHPVDEPITGVTAVSDHENAKGFTLILPDTPHESASMVKALATADGKLPLLASNRLGRESLLLSIGIAMFAGEPSALGPACILYQDGENDAAADEGDEEASVGEEETKPAPSDVVENDKEASTVTERVDRKPPLVPQITEPVQRSISMDAVPPSLANQEDAQRVKELERQLNALRSKLSKKDKAMADLQNRVKTSDATCDKLRGDLSKKDSELKDTKRNLLVAERRMQSQEDDMKRFRSDQAKAIESLNKELDNRAATILDLEKTVRILQNEKAVLSATVEARDSKLAKMTELQSSLDEMKVEASKTDDLRNQLKQAHQKYDILSDQFEKAEAREEEVLRELEDARKTAVSLEEQAKLESEKSNSCRVELDTLQMKIQKLKAERNNYKQKSDSLSKEISRVCRQGRTIKDVEKIILDDASRRQEVELLRDQKRKALEDLNHYRTAFEQSRAAQRLAGLDHETSKMYERNAELERLLSELTEYVSAKEMQLETLKEINDTLQEEIKDLHRIQMSKNLGKNDV